MVCHARFRSFAWSEFIIIMKKNLLSLNWPHLLIAEKKFDLVQIFKILNGHDRVDASILFTTVGDSANRLTRNTAYSMNVVATRSRTDILKISSLAE